MQRSGSCWGEQYNVENNRLGHGSFAEVNFGRATSDGREVAVKIASDARGIKACWTEIELLTKIGKKSANNIVKLLGYKHERDPYNQKPELLTFAMELAEYSLDRLMKLGTNLSGLLVETMIDLICDCCSAMKSLRELNIAHRDIKHLNILVFHGPKKGRRSKYLFKLCDLGGSKNSEDDTDMATLVGTPNCLHPKMARELAKGPMHKWKVDEKYTGDECDCWSLGCTLYFAACGKYPFPHGSDHNLYCQATSNLPTDAIAAELETGVAGKYKFRYLSSVSNNTYPSWFRHCLSSLIRGLFHKPDFEKFSIMSDALHKSKEYQFMSLSQMDIVRYADLSGCSSFASGYPSLRSALGAGASMPLPMYMIADDGILEISTDVDFVRLQPEVPYVVFPKKPEIVLTAKPWKKEARQEVLEACRDLGAQAVRAISLGEAFRALADCDVMIRLFEATKAIVVKQLTAELSRAVALRESTAVTLRFSHYADSQCQSFLLNTETERAVAIAGIETARTNAKELSNHIAQLNIIIQTLEESIKEINGLALDDDEIPGIEVELRRYNLSSVDDISVTSPYTTKLVQDCYNRRTGLASALRTQVRDGPLPITHVFVQTINKLVNARNTIKDLDMKVSSCTELVERPFQETKTRVITRLQQNNINDKVVRRGIDFYNQPHRVSTSAGEIHRLARELEAAAAKLNLREAPAQNILFPTLNMP